MCWQHVWRSDAVKSMATELVSEWSGAMTRPTRHGMGDDRATALPVVFFFTVAKWFICAETELRS